MPPDCRTRSGRAARTSGVWLSPHHTMTFGPAGLPGSPRCRRSKACRASAMCWKTSTGIVGVLLLLSSRRGTSIVANLSSWYVEPEWRTHSTLADGDGDQAKARDLSQCLAGAAYLAHPAGPEFPSLQFRPQRRFSCFSLRRRACQRLFARRSCRNANCCWPTARWAASAWFAKKMASFRPLFSSRAGWIGRRSDDGADLLPFDGGFRALRRGAGPASSEAWRAGRNPGWQDRRHACRTMSPAKNPAISKDPKRRP